MIPGKPDWVQSVEASISKYQEAKDLIKENFYGVASMELANAYILLHTTAKELGMTGHSAHILALSARLQLLSEKCMKQEENGGQERSIKTAIKFVEEKIREVEEKLLKAFQTNKT